MSLPELLNSHQLLQGARTIGGSKTYSSVIVKKSVTSVAADDFAVAAGDNAVDSVITLTGGVLEVEGDDYPVGSGATAPTSLNLYNVKNLLVPGKTYKVEAVPAYAAPIDQVSAESAGRNYFVSEVDGTSQLIPFIKQSVIDAVFAQGGLANLEYEVYNQTATAAQRKVYLDYKQAQDEYLDIRYNSAAPLPVVGYDFILKEVEQKTAKGGSNVLTALSKLEVLDIRSTIEFVYSRKVNYGTGGTTGTSLAVTAYGATPWLIDETKSFGYATAGDQTNDANRIPLRVVEGTFVNASTGAGVPYSTLAVLEFPGYLPRGQQASGQVAIRYISKADSLFLGRVNPIYLANGNDGPKFARGKLSRLTNWADPQSIVSFVAADAVTTGGSASSTPFIQATNLVNLT